MIIKIPQKFDVNFEEFAKAIGYTLSDFDKVNDDCYKLMTHKSIEYTIDSIIEQLKCESEFKKKSGKGNREIGYVKWEYETYECYLAIYLTDASLTYTIRCNTTNSDGESRKNVYFYFDKMTFCIERLVIEMIKDFTELIREARDLEYAFENYGYDNIPRGTHKNGSLFCCRREDMLLKPKHFYDGRFDYDDKEFKMYPWDEWVDELYT